MSEKKYKVGDRVRVLFRGSEATGTVCFSCGDPYWYHIKLDSGATVPRPDSLMHLIKESEDGRAQTDS